MEGTCSKICPGSSFFMCSEQACAIVLLKTPDNSFQYDYCCLKFNFWNSDIGQQRCVTFFAIINSEKYQVWKGSPSLVFSKVQRSCQLHISMMITSMLHRLQLDPDYSTWNFLFRRRIFLNVLLWDIFLSKCCKKAPQNCLLTRAFCKGCRHEHKEGEKKHHKFLGWLVLAVKWIAWHLAVNWNWESTGPLLNV